MSTLKASNIQPPSDSDPLIVSTNATQRVRVGSDGLVGIGTSSPLATLHVDGSSRVSDSGVKPSAGNAVFSVVSTVPVTAATTAGITLASFLSNNPGGSDYRPRLFVTATSEGIVLDESYNLTAASNLMFAIGHVEKMRLTGTGRLGLGTTSPVADIDVSGSTKQVWIRNGSGGAFDASAGAGLKLEYVGANNAATIQAYDYSTTTPKYLTLNTLGGNVGIGTLTPDAKLTVGGAVYSAANDYAANFTSDAINSGWGGILFSQDSSNAFKVWTQGTGNASPSTNYLYFDLITTSTGLTLDSRSSPAMRLVGNGALEIATSLKVANATLTPSGSAPMYACRAFSAVVNTDTSAASTAASGVIVSQDSENLTVTQSARGVFKFDFDTNMPSTTYTVVVSASADGGNRINVPLIHTNASTARIAPTASTFYVAFKGAGDGVFYNPRNFSVAVFA